ncbi:MAG: PAS domain S-box protein, partial [Cytophagia bacterium]|nr:PAS domain S-box protein [Cytophagia bacterium]
MFYLANENPELLSDLVKGFRPKTNNSSTGSIDVFGFNINYRITFSNNLYTILFLIEDSLMTAGYPDNEKYKLIVEAANEIIYEMDAAGNFTYVNPKTLTLTGFKENEILGKSYLELVHPEFREKAQKFYAKQVFERIKSTFLELPIVTKGGEQFWIGLNVQLLENDFAVTGFLGVGRDITEGYNNRLALQQSEEKYRGIIQNLHYGLMEVDLDEKIVYANEAMSQITGYTQNELIGKVASKLLADERGVSVLEKEHTKRNRGSASVYEIPIKHKDGSFRWAMISGAPIYDVDGSVKGTIGIHMDITDRIEDEQELKITRSRLKKYKDGLEALNSV